VTVSPRIAVSATIRAPLADTLAFVRYHRAIGVDLVIVSLDDPADPALGPLSAMDGVVPIACDDEHRAKLGIGPDAPVEDRLHRNAEAAFRTARDRGSDWCVTLDGDELIHAPGGLKAAFQGVPANRQVVRFPVREAVPDQLDHRDPFREVHTFRTQASRRRMQLARNLGAGGAFFAGEYLRGHRMGKAGVRTSADLREMRSHMPVLAAGPVQGRPLPGAMLLHYDCCSLAAFKRKWTWRLDGSATATDLGPPRRAQLDAFAAVAGDDRAIQALFRRLYFLSPRERLVLRALGMLTTVRLDPVLFGD
jgi:Glycosyl transferase family 2